MKEVGTLKMGYDQMVQAARSGKQNTAEGSIFQKDRTEADRRGMSAGRSSRWLIPVRRVCEDMTERRFKLGIKYSRISGQKDS